MANKDWKKELLEKSYTAHNTMGEITGLIIDLDFVEKFIENLLKEQEKRLIDEMLEKMTEAYKAGYRRRGITDLLKEKGFTVKE